MTNPPNILVLAVDCLRQDFTTNGYAETPWIDALRERGIEYTELYATTSNTTPNVASLLTGTYSERNGVNSLREVSLDDDVPTLAERLAAAGYETAAMVTGPLVEETGLDRGFDRYEYRDVDRELTGDWFDEAVDTLRSLEEPFFCYLHLWELHNPIDVPPAFDDPDFGETPYARMLSALDRRLERFVEAAPEETTLVLHGDHGESISWRQHLAYWPFKLARDAVRYGLSLDTRRLERRVNRWLDGWGHDYRDHFLEEGHGETVYDYVTNVPFVVRGPGLDPATVETQVRQVDVMPTLLRIADVEVPDAIDGSSLLPPTALEDRIAYLRACGPSLLRRANWLRGVRTPEFKYVEFQHRDREPELYDLETDPQELVNVADQHPDVVERLAAELERRSLADVEHIDIDDRLEALGYL